MDLARPTPVENSIFKPKFSHCPLCGSPEIYPWLRKEKVGVQFDLFKCRHCFSGFMNPQPKSEYLASIYATSGKGLAEPVPFAQVMQNEVEYPNATLDAKRMVGYAKRLLNPQPAGGLKALDIGSGWGFYTREALNQGFTVTAVNPGVWENQVFEQLNGFSPIKLLFEEVDFGEEKFHLVILSHVLEHLEEPIQILEKIKSILYPGGVLTIAVPSVDSILVKLRKTRDNACLWVPEHLTYFSQQGLNALLQRAGFVVKYHKYISRFPYFWISNKLSLQGDLRKICNWLVRISQWPPLKTFDYLGLGICHNIWAQV